MNPRKLVSFTFLIPKRCFDLFWSDFLFIMESISLED